MTSGFELHGIDHLSPSSLNSWAMQPALWACERLLGHKFISNASAARGSATEWGVNAGLMDPTKDPAACIEVALAHYDRAMALSPDAKRAAEREAIPGYVTNALTELRAYGVPTGYQEKIEITLPDVPVPVVGFIDWIFAQHGLLVDLKTSEKCPSAITNAHARQGATYTAAYSNHSIRFAYAKPIKPGGKTRPVTVYELDGDVAREQLAALRQIALRLERFLRLSEDPAELAGLLTPDFDSWVWGNPATRAYGREVFGY